jgi:hypothetical protein
MAKPNKPTKRISARSSALVQPPARTAIVRRGSDAERLLSRLGDTRDLPAILEGDTGPRNLEVQRQMDKALGCRTSEVANAILSQVLFIEQPDIGTASDNVVDEAVRRITAEVAELRPADATQGFLSAQMVGTHRLAMKFMARANLDSQTPDSVTRNIERGTRHAPLSRSGADHGQIEGSYGPAASRGGAR